MTPARRANPRSSVYRFTLATGLLFGAISVTAASLNRIELAPLDEVLSQAGWRLLTEDDVKATEFFAVADRAEVIGLRANDSNALIFREVSAAEQSKRYLNWAWRVDRAGPVTNLRQVGGDDRPIAVYVGFNVAARHLSLWARLRRTLVSTFTGLPKGQVMTYLWGGDDPVGSRFANPYIRRLGRMHVLRDGQAETQTWLCESIELASDFESSWGHPPQYPVYLALSADSEDTHSATLAFVSTPQFSDEPNCDTSALPSSLAQ